LKEFYKGFLFSADTKNLGTILKTGPQLFSLLGLTKNGRLKMLDIGGGGGFYAKAFEVSGYGESTYIDLDTEACVFAKEKVGLSSVLNQDAAILDAEDGKYDFIMCRHLVEHLVDPTDFILKLISVLAEGGTLLIVCPNGDSLEYFAYPNSNLKKRIDKIRAASGLSRLKVAAKLLSGEMLHGMDPPRHLWAVSRQGIQRFLTDKGVEAEIATFPLTNPVYSPYHSSETLSKKICAFFGDFVTSKFSGGTHLSVVIRRHCRTRHE
jgi:SAM-dependent methyltransferase